MCLFSYCLTDKKDLLKIINNDRYSNDIQDITIFHKSIYGENGLIHHLIKNNRAIYAHVKKQDKSFNPNGSFISHILQNYENEVIMTAFEYLKQQNYENEVIMTAFEYLKQQNFKIGSLILRWAY
jgi:hypothetical protein